MIAGQVVQLGTDRSDGPMAPHVLSAGIECPCEGSQFDVLLAPRDLSVLTARESDVLVLLSSGLGNLPIALRLGITERTVKKHVTGILDKLAVRSRLEAGLVALLWHDQLCARRTPHEGVAGALAGSDRWSRSDRRPGVEVRAPNRR
ncbi:helix-turn-helix transcriptional regulator [Kitasatospora sp. NPDC089509]|uniref:helix-turn-helix domain-containing protein n=1 Tax=Kitasatospora sp. NPDC089509 TaxID=3364079 RepID=UPI00380A1E8E